MVLLARRPRDPDRPQDRRLRWAGYLGLVASLVAAASLQPDSAPDEFEFYALLHALTGIVCIFPLLFNFR